jgi:hypothetical protein
MPYYAYSQICPQSAMKDPTARIDVPAKLTASYFNSLNAPWNTTGKDKDGRNYFSWNFKGTTISSCTLLYVYGTGKVDPGFNVTRKVTPSTLKSVNTLVTVVTEVQLKASASYFCMDESDYSTSFTTSKLLSFSVTEPKTGSTGPLLATPQPSAGDNFRVCFTGGLKGTIVDMSSVWNVTKTYSGNVAWKPYFVSDNYQCCFGTTTNSSATFDISVHGTPHVTMKIGFGGKADINWLYTPTAAQDLSLTLESESSPA